MKKPRAFRQIDLGKCSEAVRKLNPHLAGASGTANAAPTRPQDCVSALGRVETAEKSPARSCTDFDSRFEEQFNAYLQREKPANAVVHYHRYTLVLAAGLRYTPDFAIVRTEKRYDPDLGEEVAWSRIDFYECKGKFLYRGASKEHTRASLAKPRTAAEIYPQHNFFIVTKTEGGGFDIQRCKPL